MIDRILKLRCIAAFTMTGSTARLVAAERPKSPIIAFTPNLSTCRRLNLSWGVTPVLVQDTTSSMETYVEAIESYLLAHNLAVPGDTILILGGSPIQSDGGTNFLKIHTIHP